MNLRVSISIGLLCFGLMAAVLPRRDNTIGQLSPGQSAAGLLNPDIYLSADEVARSVVNEDSSLQLIDLRTPDEYTKFNIPCSVNIPLEQLANKDNSGYLNQKGKKTVFYSNGDVLSAEAWALATQMGVKNCYVMKGGLNEWYKTVMLTEFTGTTITPAENALFEVRYKARNFFTQMNSIPDSLKGKFLATKKTEAKKLVGGCE
jgi:rhodanese-related sulfurtransferase